MKNLIQNISVSIVLILVFSCSDDFLKDEPNFFREINPIVISPDWQAQDYHVFCEGVGNAKFTVAHAPAWLKISNRSGQFTNNVAMLNCKANTHKDFSGVGIYHSLITLSVEGIGNLAVPIMYINEGNPKIEIASRVTVSYDNPNSASLLVKNTGEGILLWTVIQRPEWLLIYDEMYGTSDIIEDYSVFVLPANGTSSVRLSFDPSASYSENLSGKIIIQTNDKKKPTVEVDVLMSLGNPSLYILNEFNTLDFGRTEITRNFSFANNGNGILSWKIEGCPEWLTVSEPKGILQSYNSTILTFTCNRELVPRGINEVTIYLKSNDKNKPSYAITVTVISITANPDNVKSIEGAITDAFFDRQNNFLYFTTANPNRLIEYDVILRTIARQVSLQYTPTCFSISENSNRAIIGHNGNITVVDMNSFSVTKTFAVDYNIFDIEWGDGDWVCYTPGEEIQSYYLQWKNTVTEQIYETPYGMGGTLRGKSIIKKMPHQNYIIASIIPVMASGIYVYDIHTRNVEKWFSQDLFSYRNLSFWFSHDGSYLYSALGEIYNTSLFFTHTEWYDLPRRVFNPVPNTVFWAYHDPATQSVWTLATLSYSWWEDIKELDIIQYNDADCTRKSTYYYDNFYKGVNVMAHYVFANQAGTELVVLRNATTGNAMWSLEFIPVEK